MKLLVLAEKHTRHFKNLSRQSDDGVLGIRRDECEHYAFIWSTLWNKVNNAIVSKNVPAEERQKLTQQDCGLELDEEERQEVHDAIMSGEYDDLLGITNEQG